MSLYYYIASDINLSAIDEHIHFCDDPEAINDEYFLAIKKMFDKKYVYWFDPNVSAFQIGFLNGYESKEMRKAFIARNEIVFANQQKLFNILKTILTKEGEALFYVLHGSNPSFTPISEIKINVQDFTVPFPFEFSRHVLYRLQN